MARAQCVTHPLFNEVCEGFIVNLTGTSLSQGKLTGTSLSQGKDSLDKLLKYPHDSVISINIFFRKFVTKPKW
jgi:hypothetical protein